MARKKDADRCEYAVTAGEFANRCARRKAPGNAKYCHEHDRITAALRIKRFKELLASGAIGRRLGRG